MPTPESSRRNLEHARSNGQVKFWRTWSESQRIKAEILWLHETQRDLSQRAIARTFQVSQVYVQRVLKRVRLSSGIEKALGLEAYKHYRDRLEAQRRAHFQAQGGPASLIGEIACQLSPESEPPQSTEPTAAQARVEALGVEYVQ